MTSLSLPQPPGTFGERTPSRVNRHVIAYALIILFALALRLSFFGDPAADYDEQLYQFVGQKMLEGQWPFIDLWDRKPVGLFLIYAFANWVGGPGVLPYQLLAFCAAAGGAILLYHFALRFVDRVGGAAAAMLYLLYLSAYTVKVGQSEVFYIPMLIGMAMLTLRVLETGDRRIAARLSLIVMALGGLSLQIKYTTLPQCLFFGLVLLVRHWRMGCTVWLLARRAMLYAVLGLAPTLAAMACYAVIGHLDAFLFANFLSIFERGQLSGEIAQRFVDHVKILTVPLLFCAVAGMIAFLRLRTRPTLAYYFVIGWTGSALAGFLMVGNIYPHYFTPVLPCLLLIAAPALGMTRLGAVLVCLTGGFGLMVGYPPNDWTFSHANRTAIAEATKAMLPYVGRTRDCLYVYDGPTAFYETTGSCLLTRYVYPDHLNNQMEEKAIGADTRAEVAKILHARPSVIVTASRPVVPRYNVATSNMVNAAIARDYRPVGTYRYFYRDIIVNVRRDLIPAKYSISHFSRLDR